MIQRTRIISVNVSPAPFAWVISFSRLRNTQNHKNRTFHDSTTSRNVLAELELPEPVPYVKRTTPFLTKEDARKYLYPLYSRGWEVKTMKADDGFNVQDVKSPFLVGKFILKGPKSARTLLKELLLLEEQEKHDVSFNMWSGKRPTLTIFSQTHSARTHDSSDSDDETTPNITLRDIRIAVLLEMYAKEAGVIFSPKDDSGPLQNFHDESVWKALLSKYP